MQWRQYDQKPALKRHHGHGSRAVVGHLPWLSAPNRSAPASNATWGHALDEYKGHAATVTIDQDFITIRRGTLAGLGLGVDGERRIPLGAIASVRLQDATFLRNGYLQLSVGEPRPPLAAASAVSDSDTVMFSAKQQEAFTSLYERILEIIAANQERGVDPAAVQVEPSGAELKAAAEARRVDQQAQSAESRGSRPDVARAAARMRWKLGGRRELRKLHEVLSDAETVLFIAQGTYRKRQGIVVLTDSRVLFLFHGILSQEMEDFPLGQISSVSSSRAVVTGQVIIHVPGNQAVISGVLRSDLKPLVDAIRAAVGKSHRSPVNVTGHREPASGSAAMEQLEKLGRLRQSGLLTDEEFESKKAELLKQI